MDSKVRMWHWMSNGQRLWSPIAETYDTSIKVKWKLKRAVWGCEYYYFFHDIMCQRISFLYSIPYIKFYIRKPQRIRCYQSLFVWIQVRQFNPSWKGLHVTPQSTRYYSFFLKHVFSNGNVKILGKSSVFLVFQSRFSVLVSLFVQK